MKHSQPLTSLLFRPCRAWGHFPFLNVCLWREARWVFLFKCKYIISPLVYGIHYRCLVVRVWPGPQTSCIALLRNSVTGHLQKVQFLYLTIRNPFIETGQIWCCLVHAGSNSHLTPQKAQKCKYFHLHMFSILFWLRVLCFVNWMLNYKSRTKSHVITFYCFYATHRMWHVCKHPTNKC